MSFSFLHIEFFAWMVPPVGALFYFWLTQEPLVKGQFSTDALRRLRIEADTLGLRGRNTLFLIASLLLIAAMAQPVLIDTNKGDTQTAVIIAIEGGMEAKVAFEAAKNVAIAALKEFDAVSLIAYDTQVSRIAPLTLQKGMLESLISGLTPEQFGSFANRQSMLSALVKSGELNGTDGVVIVSTSAPKGTIAGYSRPVEVIASAADIAAATERIGVWSRVHHPRPHTPLFYYPLALAMVLVWIALSSMSRRQSVPVASLLAAIVVGNADPAQAGMLDFRLLDQARNAFEAGSFDESAALYARYQQSHDLPQVRYNRATALLQGGRHKEALYWFSQVHSTDPLLMQRAKINRNIARKFAAEGTEKVQEKRRDADSKMAAQQIRTEEKKEIRAAVIRLFAFP